MNRQEIEKKLQGIVGALCDEKGYVSAVDALMRLGYLDAAGHENWRRRRVPCLERILGANLNKVSFIMKTMRRICLGRQLRPSWTGYNSWGKGVKSRLRFSVSGNPTIEQLYATHYVVPRSKTAEPDAEPDATE